MLEIIIIAIVLVLAFFIYMNRKITDEEMKNSLPEKHTITVIKDVDDDGYFVIVPTEIVEKLSPGQRAIFQADRYEIVK